MQIKQGTVTRMNNLSTSVLHSQDIHTYKERVIEPFYLFQGANKKMSAIVWSL
jgi:hypothetical protein